MTGIVVGVDDSTGAVVALRWAMDEAERRREPLTVVSVVNELPVAVPAFYATDEVGRLEDRRASTRRWAERTLAGLINERPAADGAEAHVEVRSGDPAKVLVEASADASMVVVGSRGAGGFSRLLLGSVSTAVVHHAKCPVVVVPTPDTDR